MSDQAARLRDEIAWQEKHLASLRRDWARIPYLGALAVLAVPAGLVWGVVGAVAGVVGTGVIMGMAAYLIHGHTTEYRDKISALRREAQRLESA